MAFSAIKNKASERVFGGQTVVDVPASSPNLHRMSINFTSIAPVVVANGSKYFSYLVAQANGLSIKAILAGFLKTVPAQSGGTTTIQVDTISAVDGTTTVNIVAATTLLTGFTAGIPVALTLAATNPAVIPFGDSILVTVTASNNSVGTADVGFGLTLLYAAKEASVITVSET